MYSEAAKAVMSQTTPPPTPAIVASLPRASSAHRVSTAFTLSHCFAFSPAGRRTGFEATPPNSAAVFASNTVTDASGHEGPVPNATSVVTPPMLKVNGGVMRPRLPGR